MTGASKPSRPAAAIARRYTGLSGSHVTGGGLSRADEGWLDSLPVALRQRTPVVHPADVTASALGDRGDVIGAALLARDEWAPES